MTSMVHLRGAVLLLAALLSFPLTRTQNLLAAEPDLKAPMPVDPNVKMGTLPNKFSYWIRAHKTPPGKVNIWLHVGSGSINEEDNQRGLAHFLEHMAFNGSTNFAEGTLVKYFEALGLQFGRDQNAFTSFDQTTYKLTLPDTKPETLQKGMLCLADFAYRLLLPNDKLESERGVILEEARTRKGAGQRVTDKLLPLIAPGSRFAERLPIGQEDIIKAAERERFTSYYSKWYRPDNSTLIVVGDIDPAVVEKSIVDNFTDWKPSEVSENVSPGIKDYDSVRAAVITDPELPTTEISVARIGPLLPRDTVGDFRRDLVEDLADWILNRRYAEMVAKGAAPFQSAEVGVSPFLNVCRYCEAQAEGAPAEAAGTKAAGEGEKWAAMLTSLLVEIKRAREFGFLQQEIDDAKKETLSTAEQSMRTEGTWEATAFIQNMNSSISQKLKPVSAAQNLELIKALLPGITREEVAESFKKNFDAKARLLLVTMPEKKDLKAPTEQEILDVAAKAEAAKVEALQEKQRPKSLLETEPTPGIIIAQEEEPDLKIFSGTFENGVRLHLRTMDFKKNEVTIVISIAGGRIRETTANRGVSDVAALVFQQPASSKLASTTIRDMLTGKNVQLTGAASQDMFTVTIAGSPDDIEEGLRLFHLLIIDGKIEESALKVWKDNITQLLDKTKTSVEAQGHEKFVDLLTGEDTRLKMLTREQLDKITLADSQKWLDGILKSGPIEVAIVGDITRERSLELAKKYLGSLPKREVTDKSLDALRHVTQNAGPLTATVDVDTITPRGYVMTGFRGADWKDVQDRRILQLAGEILSTRLRQEIREKRSLAYSPACAAQPSTAYLGMGFIIAVFQADPEKSSTAASIASDAIQTLAKDGPTPEELETVRKQFKNRFDSQLKQPGYWSQILGELDYRGTKLSDVKEVAEKFQSYTRDDMMAVLKKYITSERQIQVISAPKKTETAAPKPEEPKTEK